VKIITAPILLKKSPDIIFPLIIDEHISIRDFPIPEREEFFSVTQLKIDGTSISSTVPSKNSFHMAIGLDYMQLMRAETCIEVCGNDDTPTSLLQDKLRFLGNALKLLKSGSGGYFAAKFGGDKSSGFYPDAIIYNGINPLYGNVHFLEQHDIIELKQLYQIALQNGEKTKLLIKKFLHNESLSFFDELSLLKPK